MWGLFLEVERYFRLLGAKCGFDSAKLYLVHINTRET